MKRPLMDRIVEKCTQCGDCMLWKGGLASNGTVPSIWHEGAAANVRNALWRAMGKRLERGCAIKPFCKEPMCVAPEHLESRHYRKVPKSTLAKVKTAKAMRARSVLTEAVVAEIRTSTETLEVWAKRTGASTTTISGVRRHRRWKPLSSPFIGLGART